MKENESRELTYEEIEEINVQLENSESEKLKEQLYRLMLLAS